MDDFEPDGSWLTRLPPSPGRCPACHAPVLRDGYQCPSCDYVITGADRAAMGAEHDARGRRALWALPGLAVFVGLVAAAVVALS